MKKNTKKICIILILAIIAIASYFFSGMYAKYIRTLGGSDKATVAKFSVTAGDLNKTQDAKISLFDTVKEADTTTAEEHVKADRIAPGTGGQIPVTLINASDVAVKAVIKLEETANIDNVPIEYSIDGTTWKTAGETTKEVELDYVGKDLGKTTEQVTIYWRWAYAGADETDTEIGEKTTTPTVTTKVAATFTQVD